MTDEPIELPDYLDIDTGSPQDATEALPALSSDVAMSETAQANLRRAQDDVALSQAVWTAPDGNQYPLRLTGSKWSLFQSLASMIGSEDTDHVNRQWIDAGIILYLCATDPDVWDAPRTATNQDGKRIVLAPLRNDFNALLRVQRAWIDDNVSPPQWPEVVRITNMVIEKTWAAQSDPEPTTEASEKKT